MTTMYGIPDPRAPMPTDHGPDWPPPVRTTVVDGVVSYTECPSAYDVLLQQAQTIEALRKTIEAKDEELEQARGRVYQLAAEKRTLEEAMIKLAAEKRL